MIFRHGLAMLGRLRMTWMYANLLIGHHTIYNRLVVVYAIRGERIRIISAQRATTREHEGYEQVYETGI